MKKNNFAVGMFNHEINFEKYKYFIILKRSFLFHLYFFCVVQYFVNAGTITPLTFHCLIQFKCPPQITGYKYWPFYALIVS